jgi:hypothetical protein
LNTNITQPALPDPGSAVQQMVNAFGPAGTYVMAIVLAAVGLGAALIVAMFVWRNLRKWLSAAKS